MINVIIKGLLRKIMAVEYVMEDNQLCRVTKSLEAVEIGQLELDVAAKEAIVTEKTSVVEELQVKLNAAEVEVEDAESVLEDSKSGLSVAQTLVGGTDDGDEAQGVVLEEAPGVEEQVI